jgi:hypothetical protein
VTTAPGAARDARPKANGPIERALREWARRRRVAGDAQARRETMSLPAFRASVAARLQALERDVAEVRSRVNGLLFLVAGAVVTQVVLRVLG